MEVLTLKEAAAILKKHPETLREILQKSLAGELKPHDQIRGWKDGKLWRVYRDEVELYHRRKMKAQWA
jgi:Helix-turn-helix domain